MPRVDPLPDLPRQEGCQCRTCRQAAVPPIFIVSQVYVREGKSDNPTAQPSLASNAAGWYPTLKEAQQAVDPHLFEYYYNYLVIEEIHSGCYSKAVERAWYRWNMDKDRWCEIRKKPKALFGIVNFGM